MTLRQYYKRHVIIKAWMNEQWKNFNLSCSFYMVRRDKVMTGTPFGIQSGTIYPFSINAAMCTCMVITEQDVRSEKGE